MATYDLPKPLVVLLLIVSACSGAARSGPQETLHRYITAIEKDSPAEAYALLDETVRREMTPTEFASRWKTLRSELLGQAAQLKQVLDKSVKGRAQVTYPAGARAGLLFADGRWQIEDGVALGGGGATPADALKGFVRAVESRNYDTVVRFLARSIRENLERDLTERMNRLKQALHQEIEVTGGRARLQYDQRFFVELVLEDGEWRILDFN